MLYWTRYSLASPWGASLVESRMVKILVWL